MPSSAETERIQVRIQALQWSIEEDARSGRAEEGGRGFSGGGVEWRSY